ncbi:hypothetical protein VCR31J2_1440069 [Vibrio coralliirubri]|uniref:Uncharacterized protein n=1 Tax=Vibrio coralliirubri TaxID=1516159 RepID=A0AA86XVB2_9VIBR|nr:hypothetical protein VCR31J2_1440069 [Vibrio coralliirubri]
MLPLVKLELVLPSFIYPALLDPVELHAEMVRAAKIARKIFM